MTQALARVVFLSMEQIPSFHVSVAGVSFVAAGIALLLAQPARANPDMFPPIPPYPSPAGCLPVYGATICGLAGPTVGTGDLDFTYNGVAPNGLKTWAVDTDMNSNLSGPYSGFFEYSLTAPIGETWLTVALSQNIIPGFPGATVIKEVFDNANFTGSPLATLSITDANSTGFASLSSPLGIIFVRDTYTGNSTAQLDNFINTAQTPGPLPVLGAGAAFGFSRKLRGRIKAARKS